MQHSNHEGRRSSLRIFDFTWEYRLVNDKESKKKGKQYLDQAEEVE